jgi:hypothetical protein
MPRTVNCSGWRQASDQSVPKCRSTAVPCLLTHRTTGVVCAIARNFRFEISNSGPSTSSRAQAQQSIEPQRRSHELLRRFRLRSLSHGGQVARRNDEARIQLRDPAAWIRPSLAGISRPEKQRAQGRPGASSHPRPVCIGSKHTVVTTGGAGFIRPSLHDGFNGYFVLSPVTIAWLPPSSAKDSAALAPASERQDHTTSPSALASLV